MHEEQASPHIQRLDRVHASTAASVFKKGMRRGRNKPASTSHRVLGLDLGGTASLRSNSGFRDGLRLTETGVGMAWIHIC